MLNVPTNQMAHDLITEQFTQFKRNQTERSERIIFADNLIESYYEIIGEIPPSSVLDRLATLILQDELADTHPDKMTRNEFPLLSERQRDTRGRSERSLKAAQDIATDGTDYRVKTRDSNRKMREMFG